MNTFSPQDLKKLYRPKSASHKGQNGKVLIVGGSHLFHGASLFALKVASRIVDMVFYASTAENNELTQKLKSELYDFIAIPRDNIKNYAEEADVILIGPGMPRESGREKGEELTRNLVQKLILEQKDKKWVIDAGALTEMDPEFLKILNGNVIITPHPKEFSNLFGVEASEKSIPEMAAEYNCTILVKGQQDTVCDSKSCVQISGGNEGMTKGGTGDVLAGLTAALYCKNDVFLTAKCASFINKKAGDSLYKKVGPYFNASDLCDEIPKVLKEELA